MKKTPNMIKALAAVALLGISSPVGFAAGTDTWVGNTDVKWSTALNWTTSGGSTPPADGDSLVFGSALSIWRSSDGLSTADSSVISPIFNDLLSVCPFFSARMATI